MKEESMYGHDKSAKFKTEFKCRMTFIKDGVQRSAYKKMMIAAETEYQASKKRTGKQDSSSDK